MLADLKEKRRKVLRENVRRVVGRVRSRF